MPATKLRFHYDARTVSFGERSRMCLGKGQKEPAKWPNATVPAGALLRAGRAQENANNAPAKTPGCRPPADLIRTHPRSHSASKAEGRPRSTILPCPPTASSSVTLDLVFHRLGPRSCRIVETLPSRALEKAGPVHQPHRDVAVSAEDDKRERRSARFGLFGLVRWALVRPANEIRSKSRLPTRMLLWRMGTRAPGRDRGH
jgi:hypothetical protein